MARREELTDEQWALIEPLIPELPRREEGAAGRGGRGAEWKGDMPPVPDYYIHQLLSLPPERMVDGDKLAEEMNKLLQ